MFGGNVGFRRHCLSWLSVKSYLAYTSKRERSGLLSCRALKCYRMLPVELCLSVYSRRWNSGRSWNSEIPPKKKRILQTHSGLLKVAKSSSHHHNTSGWKLFLNQCSDNLSFSLGMSYEWNESTLKWGGSFYQLGKICCWFIGAVTVLYSKKKINNKKIKASNRNTPQ